VRVVTWDGARICVWTVPARCTRVPGRLCGPAPFGRHAPISTPHRLHGVGWNGPRIIDGLDRTPALGSAAFRLRQTIGSDPWWPAFTSSAGAHAVLSRARSSTVLSPAPRKLQCDLGNWRRISVSRHEMGGVPISVRSNRHPSPRGRVRLVFTADRTCWPPGNFFSSTRRAPSHDAAARPTPVPCGIRIPIPSTKRRMAGTAMPTRSRIDIQSVRRPGLPEAPA